MRLDSRVMLYCLGLEMEEQARRIKSYDVYMGETYVPLVTVRAVSSPDVYLV